MEKVKQRLPSRKEAFTIFTVCAFPIFVWSIVHTLVEIPAWLLRSNTWELIGMISYTQAFALFETLSIWLGIILISFVLPAKYFREHIVALSAIIIFTTTIWFIIIHFNDEIISEWSNRMLLFWLTIMGVSIIFVYFLVFRFEKFERLINLIVDRLSILSSIYIFIGVISLFIVLFRNIV